MKLNKVGLVAVLVAGGLLAWSTVATAQEGKAERKGGQRGFSVEQQMERMNEQLKLTDAQKPKIKAVLEESSKKRQEMFRDSNVPQDQRREKMQALTQEQDKKLKAILTSEQFEKWQKAREQMRQNRGGGERKREGQQKN